MNLSVLLPIMLAAVASIAIACGGSSNGTLDPSATPTQQPSPAPTEGPSPTATPPAPTPEPPAGATVFFDAVFTLAPSDSVTLDQSGWQLQLIGISGDSRCPIDVVCVWAGEVSASLVATDASGGQTPLEITLGPNTAPFGSFGGYGVTLIDVAPHPVSTEAIDPDDYRVTLVVRPQPDAPSGVGGRVTRGPMCPVARPDMPCPDEPYEANIEVYNAGGSLVTTIQSGPEGFFQQLLDPGEYRLVPLTPAGSPFPVAGEVSVVIEPNTWLRLDISYDTGIR